MLWLWLRLVLLLWLRLVFWLRVDINFVIAVSFLVYRDLVLCWISRTIRRFFVPTGRNLTIVGSTSLLFESLALIEISLLHLFSGL